MQMRKKHPKLSFELAKLYKGKIICGKYKIVAGPEYATVRKLNELEKFNLPYTHVSPPKSLKQRLGEYKRSKV